MVSIEFGRSPLLGKHTDALPVPPASIVRQKEKGEEGGGETISSLREDRDREGAILRSKFNSSQKRVQSRDGCQLGQAKIGTYLMRGERKRERQKEREKDGRRRLERVKLSMGLRACTSLGAQERDEGGNRRI